MKKFLKIIYHLFLVTAPKSRAVDKLVAYLQFIASHRRRPNKDFLNDKLYKIKTSDEILNVLRQYTSDKEFVKNFISSAVGDQYNVKTKAILRSPGEIEEYNFTPGEVVKPTHASGFVKFVDEQSVDKNEISGWLKLNYYNISREANYRYLTPKIIVEDQIFGRKHVDDIKFFCLQGKVKFIQWDFDRHVNHTRMLYSDEWTPLNASIGYPKAQKAQPIPKLLNEMKQVVEVLSKPFGLVRVDLYYDDFSEHFLVGEITHCHGSANEKFDSIESEKLVSRLLLE